MNGKGERPTKSIYSVERAYYNKEGVLAAAR